MYDFAVEIYKRPLSFRTSLRTKCRMSTESSPAKTGATGWVNTCRTSEQPVSWL